MMIQAYQTADREIEKKLMGIKAACLPEERLSGSDVDTALNFYADMNYVFTYELQDEIKAYLTLFVPTPEEAEMQAYTLPEYRRRGYFRALLREAIAECRKYNINSLLFVCSSSSVTAVETLKAAHAVYVFSEHKMRYKGSDQKLNLARLRLARAEIGDIEPLAELSSRIFDDTFENARSFIVKTMESKHKIQYMALLDGEIAGVCSASLDKEEATLYGLGIAPHLQGNGLGREMLKLMLDEVFRLGCNAVFLEVNCGNAAALHLYGKSGFDIVSSIDYYRFKI